MTHRILCIGFVAFGLLSWTSAVQAQLKPTLIVKPSGDDSLEVYRQGLDKPLVTQSAKADFRPYLHPVLSPDGKSLLTEYSPGHHKHQTGIYWGMTRVNDRDYFHHPEGSYWKRVSLKILKPQAESAGDHVQWQTIYDLLDEHGNGVLRESQVWSLRDQGGQYVLNLDWSGEALVDVTVGKYDYGGLFVRMPWKPNMEAHVLNNARQVDGRAEGQRAVWLDVGMKLDGRDDQAHIAIFDHPQNKGFPQPWRVDGQFGVGPVRARLGDWKIARGQVESIRHQMVVYTGERSDVEITRQWSQFSGQDMAYAQWQIAQQEGRKAEFLTPQKAVEAMTMQPGLQVNVVAAEPMIVQPMAFCWDAKGRLWIAENRDYETRQTGFANDGNSRVLILEDTDRDGVADKSQVFVENIPFPAGMAVGMGGLWLGAPPNLLFIPDRNQDDRADWDDIEVRLTGWGIRDRHETLNSFLWGPDGWLYGLQGFATPSQVGKPKGKGKLYKKGEPFPTSFEFEGAPVDINGGVWRYHPTQDRFEVVAHGFSNPWGIDFDAKGQLFITACVIPHLWHVIPGGIYHRQGGSHFNPHVYSDIRTIADHGHQSAHGGARVYQSDALPEEYRGRIFMANIHEHAVLTDILEPKGSGYVGHHGDDFLLANNAQWIGFSVEVGPDGAIYVLDWHDADICGKEVLQKETGRVFRIAPNVSQAKDFPNRYGDLEKCSDLELVGLQKVTSVWHANQARVILQHRAATRSLDPKAIASLRDLVSDSTQGDLRLRGLWCLHGAGQLSESDFHRLLEDPYEHVRGWAIQLVCEKGDPSRAIQSKLQDMAAKDASPNVRRFLASSSQRLSPMVRWPILEGLVRHAQDAEDHNLPKLIWFSLEPLVTQDIPRSLRLAEQSALPMVTRHVARRLASADQYGAMFEQLGHWSGSGSESMLLGIRDAVEGRFDMKAPSGWTALAPKLAEKGGEISRLSRQLSQQFGDSVAAEAMLKTVRDQQAALEERRSALQMLAGRKRPELRSVVQQLMEEPSLRQDAIRAMASVEDLDFAKRILERYSKLSDAEKQEVLAVLSSRSGYGNALTDALRKGTVPKKDVPAYMVRLLRRVVGPRFVDVWGPIDEVGVDKEASFTKYRELLTEDRLQKANATKGQMLFQKTCSNCHKLHGQGGDIGPDITGANRSNIEYLLSNILTPSAIIQDAYKMHIVLMEDGQVYSGIPSEENEQQLKLKVADRKEPITIAKSQIESREIAPVSMMPEGSLNVLNDQEVLDLFAYLQSQKAN